MKQSIFSFVALAIAIASLVFSFMHKAPKIGYAETSVLLSEFSEAIKARKQFEVAQKEWDKNLKLINDSMMVAMNHIKSDFDKASPKEKEALDQNLKKWNANLNRYSQAVKKQSEEKEAELMTPVISNMNTYLKVWGEQHGYDMIFGTLSGGNILQANLAFNVTSKFLQDLNEHYKDLPVSEANKVTTPAPMTKPLPISKDSAEILGNGK